MSELAAHVYDADIVDHRLCDDQALAVFLVESGELNAASHAIFATAQAENRFLTDDEMRTAGELSRRWEALFASLQRSAFVRPPSAALN